MTDPIQHITELFAGDRAIREAQLPTAPKLPDRDALRDLFEKHADWHDDNVFAGRYWIPIEDAADLAATWADEQLSPGHDHDPGGCTCGCPVKDCPPCGGFAEGPDPA